MMNFWAPKFKEWGEGFDPVDLPWELKCDYIEVWTYNAKKKDFEFHWKDDFTTFDTNRWSLLDNTAFMGNWAVFRSSQVSALDGSLVIKMEHDSHSGIWEHEHHPFYVPYETEIAIKHAIPTEGYAHGKHNFGVHHEVHSHKEMVSHEPNPMLVKPLPTFESYLAAQ